MQCNLITVVKLVWLKMKRLIGLAKNTYNLPREAGIYVSTFMMKANITILMPNTFCCTKVEIVLS